MNLIRIIFYHKKSHNDKWKYLQNKWYFDGWEVIVYDGNITINSPPNSSLVCRNNICSLTGTFIVGNTGNECVWNGKEGNLYIKGNQYVEKGLIIKPKPSKVNVFDLMFKWI